MGMKRGEVWWATLPHPVGTRTVLLISRDAAYAIRSQVLVAPVTTRRRGLAVEVPRDPRDGLPRACVVNLDTIATIPKSELRDRICVLGRAKLAAVDAAIHVALGLSD